MEKIKKLLVDGVVTIEEVLEYAETYQKAMDAFDDAQIDKYYQEQYGDNNIPEYYGDWECSEGTLHSHDEDCDCPNYKEEIYSQEYIAEMNAQLDQEEQMYYVCSPNPNYIITSTSRALEETLIYEANANSDIIGGDYGGISCRYTPQFDWTDNDLAVEYIFGKGVFEKISDIIPTNNGYHVHYKRINIVNP